MLYKKDKGILEKVQQLYADYIKWYLNPSEVDANVQNPRQKWQELLFDPECTGPDVVRNILCNCSVLIRNCILHFVKI